MARRTVPAVLVALLLGGLAASVALDVLAVETTGHAVVWPYRHLAADLAATSWSSPGPRVAAALAVLAGALLVATGVGRPRSDLELSHGTDPAGDRPWLRVVTSRRSVRRAVQAAAVGVPGVQGASVTLHRTSAHIRAHSHLRDPAGLRDEIAEAVASALAELGLGGRYRVRVDLTSPAVAADEGPTG